MSGYSRSAALERRRVAEHRAAGRFATRTPGSRVVDVIAKGAGEPLVIEEVKATRTPYAHFGPDERRDFLAVLDSAGAGVGEATGYLVWRDSARPRSQPTCIAPEAWPC